MHCPSMPEKMDHTAVPRILEARSKGVVWADEHEN